jgi:hypothetical protein
MQIYGNPFLQGAFYRIGMMMVVLMGLWVGVLLAL